ncbi:MAG: hypothetical protein U9R02_10040 [Thermodesulfobacteriota bacterium]|nr:hypothetical protein [Thermodesulfobacteriota bacterium]
MPKSIQAKAGKKLHQIWMAPDKKKTMKRLALFLPDPAKPESSFFKLWLTRWTHT